MKKRKVAFYSHLDPDITTVLAGDNGMTPDHIACLSAFTAESQDLKEMPTQRFAIALLVDPDSLERGVKITPELILTLFDVWFRLMCDACGEDIVKFTMLSKMQERMEEVIAQDEAENAPLN
jgi:hypothetical protein